MYLVYDLEIICYFIICRKYIESEFHIKLQPFMDLLFGGLHATWFNACNKWYPIIATYYDFGTITICIFVNNWLIIVWNGQLQTMMKFLLEWWSIQVLRDVSGYAKLSVRLKAFFGANSNYTGLVLSQCGLYVKLADRLAVWPYTVNLTWNKLFSVVSLTV